MSDLSASVATDRPAVAHGIPLAEEPGIGALTIVGYLQEVVGRYGDREALAFSEAGEVRRWSYREVWEQSAAVARGLVAAGVGRDSRVGVLMTNRPEFIFALFGIAMAGGVTVPLSTFSTPDELELLLRSSGVSLLLFEREIAGRRYDDILATLVADAGGDGTAGFYARAVPFLRRLVALGEAAPGATAMQTWEDLLAEGQRYAGLDVEILAAQVAPADVSTIFFSSGTTGAPKGMIHTHRAVALQWWRWPRIYAVGDDARVWTANGFFWSGLFSLVVGMAFSSGGTVVLQSVFEPARALALLESERVTVPIAKRHQWARIETLPQFAAADLSSFRYIEKAKYIQGDNASIATDWHDPRAYGATETLTNSTAIPSSEDYDPRSRDFGPPLPGNVFKIIDPATGATVRRGESGEVAVKGPTLMLGYLGKTLEETFDAEGFFLTGDAGHIDERGHLHWEGRLSAIIKTGGANVSPNEIDLIVLRYPGVHLSQTIGLPDDLMGEIAVSCVVPKEGCSIDVAELRAWLKQQLASYKVPKEILLLRADEVALTDSGVKVKIAELRKLAETRIRRSDMHTA